MNTLKLKNLILSFFVSSLAFGLVGCEDEEVAASVVAVGYVIDNERDKDKLEDELEEERRRNEEDNDPEDRTAIIFDDILDYTSTEGLPDLNFYHSGVEKDINIRFYNKDRADILVKYDLARGRMYMYLPTDFEVVDMRFLKEDSYDIYGNEISVMTSIEVAIVHINGSSRYKLQPIEIYSDNLEQYEVSLAWNYQ